MRPYACLHTNVYQHIRIDHTAFCPPECESCRRYNRVGTGAPLTPAELKEWEQRAKDKHQREVFVFKQQELALEGRPSYSEFALDTPEGAVKPRLPRTPKARPSFPVGAVTHLPCEGKPGRERRRDRWRTFVPPQQRKRDIALVQRSKAASALVALD
jgi:hypothetical protein